MISSAVRSASRRRLVAVAAALLLGVLGAGRALAGAFIFASESNGVDVITHPTGYTGTGGTLTVDVCILPTSPNKDDVEIPVQNAISIWNQRRATTANLLAGNQNDVPSGNIDFESVLLHELGHCVGLAHPNLGSESGLSGAALNSTRTTDGANDVYNTSGGADTILGSKDDPRGDDVNLHWFRTVDNDPFVIGSTVDTTTYSRDIADLPMGHDFAANADRQVSTLLGVPGTEAAMQQGTGVDESQRRIVADDIATLRLAMAGEDELQDTSDDYDLVLNYVGMTGVCDVVVQFDDVQTGFAQCNVTGTGALLPPDHLRITTANVYFNTGWNWYYTDELSVCGNDVVEGTEACDDGDVQSGDGCNTVCEVETGWSCTGDPSVCSECGDGMVGGTETCDDGGTTPGDGCDATCQQETGWMCSGEPSTCDGICSDGLIRGAETCDDGDTDPGDGCDAVCQEESGWSCAGEPSACSEVCGDGIITASETCDDGDTDPGDGCDGSCQEESGWSCVGEPSSCTLDPPGVPALGAFGRLLLVAGLLLAAHRLRRGRV